MDQFPFDAVTSTGPREAGAYTARGYGMSGKLAGNPVSPIPGSNLGSTLGIAPAQQGRALNVLQYADRNDVGTSEQLSRNASAIQEAAAEVAYYHTPNPDQQERHRALSAALVQYLTSVVALCPPGPERSTAISRAREAKYWASAAIAMEGR